MRFIQLTLLWYVDPYCILPKGLLVAIELLEVTTGACIHGCILLMAEDDAWTWNTIPVGFDTLSTVRLLLVTFQLESLSIAVQVIELRLDDML